MKTLPVWSPPPGSLTLTPDAVHVWRARLDLDEESMDAMEALLATEERARAARFRFRRDRRRYVAACGQLRSTLSGYLGCTPEAITFQYGAHGKPEVSALEFNVSHTGDIALYAVALKRRVGIDVEAVRALADADRIVDRFFSAREVEAYRALPAEERADAFVTCWTRKEAFIKALGEGLSHPLDAFDVTVRSDEPATLLAARRDPAAADRWHMQALPVGAGYAATVTAEDPPWDLTCFDASARVPRHA